MISAFLVAYLLLHHLNKSFGHNVLNIGGHLTGFFTADFLNNSCIIWNLLVKIVTILIIIIYIVYIIGTHSPIQNSSLPALSIAASIFCNEHILKQFSASFALCLNAPGKIIPESVSDSKLNCIRWSLRGMAKFIIVEYISTAHAPNSAKTFLTSLWPQKPRYKAFTGL